MRNGYQKEIDAAIRRAEIAERKAAEKDAVIERQKNRIGKLDRKANPEAFRPPASETRSAVGVHSTPNQKPPPSFIDNAIMERTLSRYDINPLHIFLAGTFGKEEADRLCRLYRIGTSRKWGGAAVFWQVDGKGRVRTGKIMLYDAMHVSLARTTSAECQPRTCASSCARISHSSCSV